VSGLPSAGELCVGLCKHGFIVSPGNTARNNCNTLIINAQQIHTPVHKTFCTLLWSVMDHKTVQIMKETPRRRITVKSSLFEVSKDQLGNRVVVRGKAILSSSPPLSTAGFWTDL
jgi:hypothetical protein